MTTNTQLQQYARDQEFEHRPREAAGWRAGRPVEDPAKTKRWGFVTAKPSEFLVHCRRGRVLGSSGQGATCFKWPWDSVAVVPTSFQRLRFVADQVTSEKVGVGVTGIAVYRIAEPLLAFRVLNFSFPERAQEKLETTMTEMLMGATRRLVANLTVEECLRKRKAALADELLAEIAPVVGGIGHPDDGTDRGWGIVLDTIEIQEVRVLSEKVFSAMQEPFRARLDQDARQARAEADKASALSEAESRREIENARLNADAAVQARRGEIERQTAESRAQDAVHLQELELVEERARVEANLERRSLQRQELEAEIQNHELTVRRQQAQDEVLSVALAARLERQRSEAEVDLVVGRQRADVSLAAAQAEKERAVARARVLTAENLPQLAGAVGGNFGEVKVVQMGGDQSPFASIAQAVMAVMELARGDD